MTGTHPIEVSTPAAAPEATTRSPFLTGFLAMMPLWAGAIPTGVAFSIAAGHAGFSTLETQLMSLTVFSAAAQFSLVSLTEARASTLLLVGTALALNAQLPLIGLTAGRQTTPSWRQRLAAASFLTDGAYGVTAGLGRLRLPVLAGAGAGMYTGWNLGTALGIGFGRAIPDPARWGVDLVAPLTFLAVLVPLLRSRVWLLVAAVAGLTAVIASQFVPVGVGVLIAGLAGSGVGMVMDTAAPVSR